MDRRDCGLLEELRERVARECVRGGPTGIARVETVIPCTDPLAWLRAQDATAARLYWADRDGAHEVAGVGAADLAAHAGTDGIDLLFGQVRRRLEGVAPGARYFGGLRFSGRTPADAAWREFGGCGFVLPRFELSRRESDSVLACQWLRSEVTADALMAELGALVFAASENRCIHPTATGRRDLPGRAAWDAAVTETLELVSKGDLDKVVLARKSTFGFADGLDPLACLQALMPETERCYRFCFVPGAGRGFLGASPERLYRREGRRILCDALAGTRTRGDRASLDRRLEQDLMGSDKERREQDYVVRGIRESLAPLCSALNAGADPSVMKLRNWQHLMSRFEGVLRDGVGDADLLMALHPTPAVGGYPTGRALREIEKREPFDRGWYAGPVGWVGHDGAEFAVAIRSALVEGSTLSVFAGAGIVAGSVPEDEWAELDYKIRHFTQALNLPR
ncbi:MAG: isochorismate synthase [Deltaproteobacteria bacterium]|nr:isochorismate synthase [Deltaproteobacteria bacterium]